MPVQMNMDFKGPQQQAQSSVPMAGNFNGNPGTVYNTKPAAHGGISTPDNVIGMGGVQSTPQTSSYPAHMNPPVPQKPGVPYPNQNPTPYDYGGGMQANYGMQQPGQWGGLMGWARQFGNFGAPVPRGGMQFPMPQFSPGFMNSQGYGYSNDSMFSQPWMGGQNANLGRYAPPMFDMSGRSINQGQGGYAYNLPNAYGPFPMFSQFGMGQGFNTHPWTRRRPGGP
jgi:hypothetical protein